MTVWKCNNKTTKVKFVENWRESPAINEFGFDNIWHVNMYITVRVLRYRKFK